MKNQFIPAVRLTIVCLVVFSGLYTFAILGIAQMAPNKGKGFVVKCENVKSEMYIGSTSHISHFTSYQYENIGQAFTEDKYFNSRPSAVDYNAAGSCGSNKGNSNPDYLATVQARIDTFLVHNPDVKKAEIPSELVTASGSGLDPNISIAAAKIQIKRIAKIRNISEDKLLKLVNEHTENPVFGLFGPSKVNVLKLNLALLKSEM